MEDQESIDAEVIAFFDEHPEEIVYEEMEHEEIEPIKEKEKEIETYDLNTKEIISSPLTTSKNYILKGVVQFSKVNKYIFPRSLELQTFLEIKTRIEKSTFYREDFDSMFHFMVIYTFLFKNGYEPYGDLSDIQFDTSLFYKDIDLIEYKYIYEHIVRFTKEQFIPTWYNTILNLIPIYSSLPSLTSNKSMDRQYQVFLALIREDKKIFLDFLNNVVNRFQEKEIKEKGANFFLFNNPLHFPRPFYVAESLLPEKVWRIFTVEDFEYMKSFLDVTEGKQNIIPNIFLDMKKITRKDVIIATDYIKLHKDELDTLKKELNIRAWIFNILPKIGQEEDNKKRSLEKKTLMIQQIMKKVIVTPREFFENIIAPNIIVKGEFIVKYPNKNNDKHLFIGDKGEIKFFKTKQQLKDVLYNINDIKVIEISYLDLYKKDLLFIDQFQSITIKRFWKNDDFSTLDCGNCQLVQNARLFKSKLKMVHKSPEDFYDLVEGDYKLVITYKIISPFDIIRNILMNNLNIIYMDIVDAQVFTAMNYSVRFTPIRYM